MYRILFFLGIIFVPIIFGWWLFVPLSILLVYLAKLPYEIVLAGLILDLIYYFGEGFIAEYLLTIFSLFIIVAAWFLGRRIHWRKII